MAITYDDSRQDTVKPEGDRKNCSGLSELTCDGSLGGDGKTGRRGID
ncbi:MAG: hypothetical protein JJU32_06090 [Phormidium sp. BM_Day4_Bin.17]|nr:hypothetical protein [Phormidium sp. BM_Day4_Bin.17]UCJ12295.1 MAG: hypothetical protein JWS08_00165 [Phormidium sp. PBR-2020]